MLCWISTHDKNNIDTAKKLNLYNLDSSSKIIQVKLRNIELLTTLFCWLNEIYWEGKGNVGKIYWYNRFNELKINMRCIDTSQKFIINEYLDIKKKWTENCSSWDNDLILFFWTECFWCQFFLIVSYLQSFWHTLSWNENNQVL